MDDAYRMIDIWFRLNKLMLYNKKTKTCFFTLKDFSHNDNTKIKFLKFTLDQKLTWEYHIDNVFKKCVFNYKRIIKLLQKIIFSDISSNTI